MKNFLVYLLVTILTIPIYALEINDGGIGLTYNDLYFPLVNAKVPAVNAPDWETYSTNLNSYTFDVDDYADLACGEILHGWKEGDNLDIHLHLITNGTNTETIKAVKYTIYYDFGSIDKVMYGQRSLTAEQTIGIGLADKTHLYLDMGDMSVSTGTIGSILKMRLYRVEASTTAPVNDPFVEMVGIHYRCNALGSRQELVK